MDLPLAALFSKRLKHFAAIYQYRNLRLAAESEGLSQPAMSKSLKIFEDQLDVTLFNRANSGLVPTEAADFLAQRLEQFSDLARVTDVELSSIRGSDGGEIRIGAGQMWSWLFIPKIVSAFSEAFEAVSLEVTTGPMLELIRRLSDGELDVIVGDFDGVQVPEGFKMQHSWTPEFCAFASADHPLAGQQNISATELVAFPWAGYLDRDVFEYNVNFWCRKTHVSAPNISIKATSLATMLRLTSAGKNIAVLPAELEDEVKRWGLVRLNDQKFSLWTARTGSIVEERRASVKQYKYLLELIQQAGSAPSRFMTRYIDPD